jgi:phage baseplate assembly protein W
MILNLRDRYAYDISKNVISDGEIWDEDVISQSIEMIISTMFGERLFNPFFGSPLHSYLAEGVTRKTADRLLNSVLTAIKRWEDRITIIEDGVELVVSTDGHTIRLRIPYSINKSQIISTFDKKILL